MKKFVLPLSLTLALVGCSLFPVEPERPPDPSAARDPGARAGAAGTGGPLAGLTATELAFFNTGKDDFVEVENVVDGQQFPLMTFGSYTTYVGGRLSEHFDHPFLSFEATCTIRTDTIPGGKQVHFAVQA